MPRKVSKWMVFCVVAASFHNEVVLGFEDASATMVTPVEFKSLVERVTEIQTRMTALNDTASVSELEVAKQHEITLQWEAEQRTTEAQAQKERYRAEQVLNARKKSEAEADAAKARVEEARARTDAEKVALQREDASRAAAEAKRSTAQEGARKAEAEARAAEAAAQAQRAASEAEAAQARAAAAASEAEVGVATEQRKAREADARAEEARATEAAEKRALAEVDLQRAKTQANVTMAGEVRRRLEAEAEKARAEAERASAEAAAAAASRELEEARTRTAEEATKAAVQAALGEKARAEAEAAVAAAEAARAEAAEEQRRAVEATVAVKEAEVARETARAQAAAAEGEEERKTVAARAAAAKEEAATRAAAAAAARRADTLAHEDRERTRIALEARADKEREKLRRATELARVEAEAEGRARQERDNEDVARRRQELEGQLRAEETKAAIVTAISSTVEQIVVFASSPEAVAQAIGVLGAAAAAFFAAREAARVVAEEIQRRLGKPALVRETSRVTVWRRLLDAVADLCNFSKGPGSAFKDVVLEDEVMSRVVSLAKATRNARSHGASYRHLMFFGPPGTGKTMVARRIAALSGMDYAMMSGGDVGPLGAQAVTEVHRLFAWAKASPRGLLLFIDEAEAFLGSRGAGSLEHRRNALNALLFQTGDAAMAKHFMLVVATNRPGDLDAAVLDRIDESVEFHLPAREERRSLLQLYMSRALGPTFLAKGDAAKQAKPRARRCRLRQAPSIRVEEDVDDKVLEWAAGETEGFSGREIAKLGVAVQNAAFASDDCAIGASGIRSTVQRRVGEHRRQEEIAEKRIAWS